MSSSSRNLIIEVRVPIPKKRAREHTGGCSLHSQARSIARAGGKERKEYEPHSIVVCHGGRYHPVSPAHRHCQHRHQHQLITMPRIPTTTTCIIAFGITTSMASTTRAITATVLGTLGSILNGYRQSPANHGHPHKHTRNQAKQEPPDLPALVRKRMPAASIAVSATHQSTFRSTRILAAFVVVVAVVATAVAPVTVERFGTG